MSRSKSLNHFQMLLEEIATLQRRIKPEDTGHIHTAISVLQGRVEEIKKELEGKMNE
jgi:hypothetical protein|tara:strand:- start:977 stop:1147 length:171 start_codon:yes stop_codon:yes gene_type:complete